MVWETTSLIGSDKYRKWKQLQVELVMSCPTTGSIVEGNAGWKGGWLCLRCACLRKGMLWDTRCLSSIEWNLRVLFEYLSAEIDLQSGLYNSIWTWHEKWCHCFWSFLTNRTMSFLSWRCQSLSWCWWTCTRISLFFRNGSNALTYGTKASTYPCCNIHVFGQQVHNRKCQQRLWMSLRNEYRMCIFAWDQRWEGN